MFVDSGGAFNIHTECVNGSRGNAADHLTKDVLPFMIFHLRGEFGAIKMGCGRVFGRGYVRRLDLAVMRPDLFSAFVDICGDLSPNTGSKAQTIDWLFGGDAAAWNSFDPTTVITRHGRYEGVSGWFVISGARQNDQSPNVSDRRQRRAACGWCAVWGRDRQRDTLHRRRPARHPRLAFRAAGVHVGHAIAGGPTRHSRHRRNPASVAHSQRSPSHKPIGT